MGTIYLISLIVGGFFVILSMFGGDSDTEVDIGGDVDMDVDVQIDADMHVDSGGFDHGGVGFIDLLSVRTLFFFLAFFGLSGTLFNLMGTVEPIAAILSTITGAAIGLGANYLIKTVGYKSVSSAATTKELQGATGEVLLPFETGEKGKIWVRAKGQRLQLIARSIEGGPQETFNKGEEIVIVRMDGSVAEVVKPN